MSAAYSDLYLSDAKNHLGAFAHFGTHACGIDPDELFTLFDITGVAYQFGRGNPAFASGKSGYELLREVLTRADDGEPEDLPAPPESSSEKSPEFWAGWALAHYQWKSGLGFARILKAVPFSEIIALYPLFHEMDIAQFLDEIDRRVASDERPTNLRRQREIAGLSQSELARASQVGLRSIQMYEQRVNDIDKAQAHTVYKLALALGCAMEDLLEQPLASRVA